MIATTGLDQDMMQRNLACRNSRESQKNMIVSSISQFFVIALFLVLGTLLVMYAKNMPGLSVPEKTDELFGLVASHGSMPVVVGVVFVLGLVSAAYSAAGSALTSLTTSFTVDILGASSRPESRLTVVRRVVHLAMSVVMGLVIIVFYYISDSDAISAVYMLASYTYGPILGNFGTFPLWACRALAGARPPCAGGVRSRPGGLLLCAARPAGVLRICDEF